MSDRSKKSKGSAKRVSSAQEKEKDAVIPDPQPSDQKIESP